MPSLTPGNCPPPDWPTFTPRPGHLHRAEEFFLRGGGVIVGCLLTKDATPDP